MGDEHILIKRVQKEIRAYGSFKKGHKVLIITRNHASSHLLKHALKDFSNKIPFITEEKSLSKKGAFSQKGYAWILLPLIADELIVEFLEEIMNSKKMQNIPDNVMLPLKRITKEELNEYAKGYKAELEPSETQDFIDKLEAKFPGTKHALLKSWEAFS